MKQIETEKIAVRLKDSDSVEVGEIVKFKLGSVYQTFQVVSKEGELIFVDEEAERLEIISAINRVISPYGGTCHEIDWEDPQEDGGLMPVTAYTTGFDPSLEDYIKSSWAELIKLGYDVSFDDDLA